ncbi:MAG: tetratricopeptide repeat protein [Pseudomonadota bacterium]
MAQSGPKKGYSQSAGGGFTPHQDRVYGEMFRAIEQIGRRLEKTETERDSLRDRIDSLESQAEQDSLTGRYYLPVRTDNIDPYGHIPTPKWVAASVISSMLIAVVALGVVMLREPSLTTTQLAALSMQPAQFESQALHSPSWQRLETRQTPYTEAETGEQTVASLDIPEADETPEMAVKTENTDGPRADPLIQSILDTLDRQQQAFEDQAETLPVTGQESAEEENNDRYVELNPVEEIPTGPTTEEIMVFSEIEGAIPLMDIEPSSGAAAQETSGRIELDLAEALAQSRTSAKDPGNQPDTDPSIPSPENTEDKTGEAQPAVDADLPEEAQLLHKRALEGIAEAQHDLAALYAAGETVEQDYAQALYWFGKAAEGGIANAYYNLGVMHHQGLGLPEDRQKAVDQYEKAAELGHPEAWYNLGIAYAEGLGAAQDINRGAAYFERAAEAGIVQAAYNLGILYEDYPETINGKENASHWYQFAAERGHSEAQEAYSRLNLN